MRALYWERPTAAAAGEFGLKPSDFDEPKVSLWVENVDPIGFFSRHSSQWRTGPGGAVGLDYGVIFHELDRKGVVGDAFDDFMDAIRVIEGEALKILHQSTP